MIAESYPSWFGPRVLFEDKSTCVHEWEMRGYRDCCKPCLRERGHPSVPPYDAEEELEKDAAARVEHHIILTRDDPPKLWVVLGEGVLRQAVGGARVMREQLDHLLRLADAQGIVLQVLHLAVSDARRWTDPRPCSSSSTHPRSPTWKGGVRGRVIKDPKEVVTIATALSMIKGCALSPIDSAQLITEIRSDL